MRVTQSLLNLCYLFFSRGYRVLHLVHLLNCEARVVSMLLPLDSFLLMLAHLESEEVELLFDRLTTFLFGA